MSIPALQALRSRFPRAHIAILAKPWVAHLYGREPFCDELIPYNASGGLRSLSEKRALAASLHERVFDAAILLPNSFEAAALVWAARIPRRIGYRRDGRGWLLTQAIEVPDKGEIPIHQRFYYLELLKRAGLIESYPTGGGIALAAGRAAAILGANQFRDRGVRMPVVGVSPGAAYGGAKRWLPERFAAAALKLARARHASIVIFGSKEEAQVCQLVQRAVEAAGGRCANLSGATDLGTFVEMAAACEVYLTNDSGPMHIASALGIPTVVVFGATDEQATGPTGDSYRIVREPVECSPCLLRECPIDHRCMVRVSADRVVEAALDLMNAVSK